MTPTTPATKCELVLKGINANYLMSVAKQLFYQMRHHILSCILLPTITCILVDSISEFNTEYQRGGIISPAATVLSVRLQQYYEFGWNSIISPGATVLSV